MRISPRYDATPILDLGQQPNLAEPFVRQHRRLEAIFASLDDDQWRAPTRCESWCVQDIATHLTSVNGFFLRSISAGLAGSPTQFLDGFDPKATPAALVDDVGTATPAETLAALVDSDDALCGLLSSLDEQQWATTAEGPPGFVPVELVAQHALWDSWIHERDVALPLGLPVVEEPDEVAAALRYVAGFCPSVALMLHRAKPGVLVVDVTGSDDRLVVDVTDRVVVHDRPPAAPTVVLADTAANLVEMLTARTPLPDTIPADDRWLVDTLAVVFETEPG